MSVLQRKGHHEAFVFQAEAVINRISLFFDVLGYLGVLAQDQVSDLVQAVDQSKKEDDEGDETACVGTGLSSAAHVKRREWPAK